MISVDTSVIVAGFASWHEHHDEARRTLDQKPRLIAHCAVESYSVLTRLPPPHRAPADVVASFLTARFAEPPLALPTTNHTALVRLLAERGITGGAAYDALVAATAEHHDAELVTLDVRAERSYRLVGARFRSLLE